MKAKQISAILRCGSNLKDSLQGSLDKLWVKYVYAIWKGKTQTCIQSMTDKPSLSKQQIKEIRDYWFVHGNQKNIETNSHQFYYKTTGIFDVRFIPIALYFTAIDKFYNNWPIARVVDNKTAYDRLFPDIPQPEVIAKRINGLWRSGGGYIQW